MIVERQKLFEHTTPHDDAAASATAKVELQQHSNNMDVNLGTGKSSGKKETLAKHEQQQAGVLQCQQQHQQNLLQLQQCEQPQHHQSSVKHQIPSAAPFSATSIDKSSAAHKPKCYSNTADVVNIDSDSAADAYDADVDDVVDEGIKVRGTTVAQDIQMKDKQSEREHIYQLFQPWALKTYGDQAKTKTITLRKKARILKALEGKEHSRPDSSKFRFWVKSKAFTTKRPEGFAEVPGSQRKSKQFPPDAVLSDNPSEVDLFVGSTNKNFGQRTYRKVAVVEEFFDIIYNVHMELGGRSGMHAGQKRTYRIITETYGFLPREAVTRFLSTCPECKKNLRPSSPATSSGGGGGRNEEPNNESSSEVDALNYSSHTESSIEGGTITAKSTTTTATITTVSKAKKRRFSANQTIPIQQQQHNKDNSAKPQPLKSEVAAVESFETPAEPMTSALPHLNISPTTLTGPSFFPTSSPTASSTPFNPIGAAVALERTATKLTASLPKIRINPHFQRHRPSSPVLLSPHSEPVQPFTTGGTQFNPLCLDFASLKTHDSLFRYYEFMRRFYGGSAIGFGGSFATESSVAAPPPTATVLAPPIYGSSLLQSLRFPTGAAVPKTATATPALRALGGESQSVATNIIEMSDDDDDDVVVALDLENADASSAPPTPKKFKLSQESSYDLKTQAKSFSSLSVLKGAAPQNQAQQQQQQSSAINLSKDFHFSSNGKTAANTASSSSAAATVAAASSAIKVECSSAASASINSNTCRSAVLPAHSDVTTLRIPQISRPASLLPPLDLERLKPITSTYLQLTRSMGLSDEDALRFDNLLTTSKMVRHRAINIKPNGENIEPSLSSFEDGKKGADEFNIVTTVHGKNFPTHARYFSRNINEFQPVEFESNKYLMEPQKNLPTGMHDGQLEEPVQQTISGIIPSKYQNNWNGFSDFPKQSFSTWKAIDSNTNKNVGSNFIDTNINEPGYTQVRPNEVFRMPIMQQKTVEPETTYNLNGVHNTPTYSPKPTIIEKNGSTDSVDGPQRKFISSKSYIGPQTKTADGHLEEPVQQTISGIIPIKYQHNWKGFPDLPKQPFSTWKPKDSNTNKNVGSNFIDTNINEPGHTQVRPNEVFRMPVMQQKPLEPETPYNLNGVHNTQTYSPKPTITKKTISTDSFDEPQRKFISSISYNGPQTVFTGNLPNIFGWKTQNENPSEMSWRKYVGGVEQTNQRPEYYINQMTEKYLFHSLGEFFQDLFGGKQIRATLKPTNVLSTIANQPSAIINIADLPTVDSPRLTYTLNNDQTVHVDSFLTATENVRTFEASEDGNQLSYHSQNVPMNQENGLPLPSTQTPEQRESPTTEAPILDRTPKYQVESHQNSVAKFLKNVDLLIEDV